MDIDHGDALPDAAIQCRIVPAQRGDHLRVGHQMNWAKLDERRRELLSGAADKDDGVAEAQGLLGDPLDVRWGDGAESLDAGGVVRGIVVQDFPRHQLDDGRRGGPVGAKEL